MTKVDGVSPRVHYTNDDVRIDMPPEELSDVDTFEPPPKRSPLSVEIDQKKMANAEALADGVERALHMVVQRSGTFEDVMACIMAYIISKTKDKIDRRSVQYYQQLSKPQTSKERLEQADRHVNALLNDTLNRSKLPKEERETAAKHIQEGWAQGKNLIQEQDTTIEQKTKELATEIKTLTEEQNYAIEMLQQMIRLFQDASRRNTVREA